MAVTLDGSNDFYSNAGLFSVAKDKLPRVTVTDGKVGTFACWFRRGTVGTLQTLISLSTGASERFVVRISASNLIEVQASNASGTEIMLYAANTALTDTTKYHHLVTSWDLAASKFRLYVDRSSDLGTITTQTNDSIDYTGDTAAVGARSHDAANKYNGSIEEEFLDITTFVELDTQSELGKFVSLDNQIVAGTSAFGLEQFLKSEPGDQFKIVGYGRDVNLATGSRPVVYLSGSPQSFRLNRGTTGDFTVNGDPQDDRGPNAYRRHARWSTKGQRWFESERSGFLYPRGRTFIERREGLPSEGQRMGTDERDSKTRDERPGMTFNSLIFRDREDDTEERDR